MAILESATHHTRVGHSCCGERGGSKKLEELTADQRDELRHDLEVLAAELERLLATLADAAAPVDLAEPIGRLSRMNALQQQKMARANEQSSRLRLDQTRSALARFPADDYGLCRGCEEEIGYARLKARPEALFCIACQGRRERA